MNFNFQNDALPVIIMEEKIFICEGCDGSFYSKRQQGRNVLCSSCCNLIIQETINFAEVEIFSKTGIKVTLKPNMKIFATNKDISDPQKLISVVCDILNIDKELIAIPYRGKDIVICRVIIAYLLKQNLRMSSTNIAKILCMANHTSVLHLWNLAEKYNSCKSLESLTNTEYNSVMLFRNMFNKVISNL